LLQLTASFLTSSERKKYSSIKKFRKLFETASRREALNLHLNFNENTVADDFVVFVKMYQSNEESAIKILKTVFQEYFQKLICLKQLAKEKTNNTKLKTMKEINLPEAVLLFSILDNPTTEIQLA
jgi:hypothetical protein